MKIFMWVVFKFYLVYCRIKESFTRKDRIVINDAIKYDELQLDLSAVSVSTCTISCTGSTTALLKEDDYE